MRDAEIRGINIIFAESPAQSAESRIIIASLHIALNIRSLMKLCVFSQFFFMIHHINDSSDH